MPKKKVQHKYLVHLYSRVNDFLNDEEVQKENLPDTIVSFCIVVEKILKIKLYKKNPFLVFDVGVLRIDNMISAIALKKDKDIETAKIFEILDRFRIVFKKVFNDDETEALKDIYKVRSGFIHSHKEDNQINFDEEDILKKMGTTWGKISELAISLLGKDNIKNREPKKKYTQKELEEALESEVRKMIEPPPSLKIGSLTIPTYFNKPQTAVPLYDMFAAGSEKCPRCGQWTLNRPTSLFSTYSAESIWKFSNADRGSGLYKCQNCNLELTEKQYEIAKRLAGQD